MSPFIAELLSRPSQRGIVLGHGYVRFAEDVVAVTPPGALRMPNGIEASMTLIEGQRAAIGAGQFRVNRTTVTAGPIWDARPLSLYTLWLEPQQALSVTSLVGRGPGLTPLGDDILMGYLAGRALAGEDVAAVAEDAARRTTALSATLLRLAARGYLPEAAHRLLETGDVEPLLRFGATSGRGIAVGLALAGEIGADSALVADLPVGRFRLLIGRRGDVSCPNTYPASPQEAAAPIALGRRDPRRRRCRSAPPARRIPGRIRDSASA
jgi:uncharacterized protein DUF2877